MSDGANIFECNSDTCSECIQNGLFASNLPWPLEVKTGDICFLYLFTAGTLFGVWRAERDGALNIIPRIWGGRFPFQIKVRLVSSEIVEVPAPIVAAIAADSSNGRLDNRLDVGRARELLTWAKELGVNLDG